MDSRTLGAVIAVWSMSFFYVAWRLWNLQSARARPGTRLAALGDAQRRERLKRAAMLSALFGSLILGSAILLWLRSGG